jgi:hypothetical protein
LQLPDESMNSAHRPVSRLARTRISLAELIVRVTAAAFIRCV